ncbi:hypothetical protein OAN93_01095 [Candidatus Marinimicrobia bacterium]|nr:hypothetical protein [Candidatus Neomarinimicrobiota bacterium]
MKKLLITITMLFMITGCEDKDAGSSMTKTFINLLPEPFEFQAVVDGIDYTIYVNGFQTKNYTFDCESSDCDFDSIRTPNNFCRQDSYENSGDGPDSIGDTIYNGYDNSYIHLYHQGDAPIEYFCPFTRTSLE